MAILQASIDKDVTMMAEFGMPMLSASMDVDVTLSASMDVEVTLAAAFGTGFTPWNEANAWIMGQGIWNDTGKWIDTSTWNDGV